VTLALAGIPGQFDESKHPRARGGKFASKGGADEPAAGSEPAGQASGVSRPHLEAAVELATRARNSANPLAGEMMDKAQQLRKGAVGKDANEGDSQATDVMGKQPWQMSKAEFLKSDTAPGLTFPKKLYHGTRANFEGPPAPNTATQWGKAAYFATDPTQPRDEYGHGGRVLEYFGDFKKPLTEGSSEYRQIVSGLERHSDEQYQSLIDRADEGSEEAQRALDEFRPFDASEPEGGAAIGAAARALGHDAIIAPGHPSYGDEVAVFDTSTLLTPEQLHRREVKRAITAGLISGHPDYPGLHLSAALSLNCGTGAGGFQPGNTCGKGSAELIGVAGVNLDRELRPPKGTGLDALPSLRRTARLLADARYHGVMQGRTPERQAFAAEAERAFGESLKAVAEGLPAPGVASGDVATLRGALVIDPAELGGEREGALALAAKASPVAGPGFDGLVVVVPEGPVRKAFAAITNAGDQASFGDRLKDSGDPEGLLNKLWDASRAPVEERGGAQFKRVAERAVIRKRGDSIKLMKADAAPQPA
jgi:hypothetical protein